MAHCDLKPANLLIGADYQLKIADFDLCTKMSDKKIVTGGTEDFRAPEMRNQLGTGSPKSADIYSAAIILFVFRLQSLPCAERMPNVNGKNLTKLLQNGDFEYWDLFSELSGIKDTSISLDFKRLIFGMTCQDKKKRMTIEEIKKSDWYNGPTYTDDELARLMKHIMYSNKLVRYFGIKKVNKKASKRLKIGIQ
mmetsp:Transcript_137108/g.194003  ORF Transcript_137108/g.194003 Transcript_137108/m.194003 type:complete len:194 (-) Transcript_137108:22-603(-)